MSNESICLEIFFYEHCLSVCSFSIRCVSFCKCTFRSPVAGSYQSQVLEISSTVLWFGFTLSYWVFWGRKVVDFNDVIPGWLLGLCPLSPVEGIIGIFICSQREILSSSLFRSGYCPSAIQLSVWHEVGLVLLVFQEACQGVWAPGAHGLMSSCGCLTDQQDPRSTVPLSLCLSLPFWRCCDFCTFILNFDFCWCEPVSFLFH